MNSKVLFLVIASIAACTAIPFFQSKSLNCAENETAIYQIVFCIRAPCPPIYRCVAKSLHICSEYKPCLNGGICRSEHGDFLCTCKTGFVGRYCEQNLII